jgi:hypothetical protein
MILTLCSHKNTSWPFWNVEKKENYVVCLSCSLQLPWAWSDGLELKPPRPTQTRKPEMKEMTGIERHELMVSAELAISEEIAIREESYEYV